MSTAVTSVALSRIVWSKTNPRHDFGNLKELAASIKDRGLLQPIVVRKHPENGNRLEGIIGERRFRAAKLAGLEHIDAIIREMEDREVRESQHIENLQREDVSELDKAESYKALMKLDPKAYTVDGLAEKFRVSRRSIYVTLQLLKLDDSVKTLLREGAVTHSHAILLAPLTTTLQANVAKAITQRRKQEKDYVPTVRELKRQIDQDVLRNLKTATFPTADATLPRFDGKGACLGCPYNTTTDPEAYPDAPKETCMNPRCFSGKVAAQIERTALAMEKEAKEKGTKVLRVLAYGQDERGYRQGDNEERAALVKKGVLAPDAYREVKHNAKGAVQAIVIGGEGRGTTKWVTTQPEGKVDARGRHVPSKAEKAKRQAENLEQRTLALAKRKFLDAVRTKTKFSPGVLRALVQYAIERSYDTAGVVKGLGWIDEDGKPFSKYGKGNDLDKRLAKMSKVDELAGVGLFALAYTERPYEATHGANYAEHSRLAATLAKVELPTFLAAAKAEMKATAKAKATKQPKAKAAAKKPARRAAARKTQTSARKHSAVKTKGRKVA
jgi:ParB/RepB/Spo0J family partition protein